MSLFTTKGYQARTANEFRTLIRREVENELDASVDWGSDVVLSMLTDIAARLIGEVAAKGQQVYDMFDPDNAEDVFVDNLLTISAVRPRRAAQKSTVELELSGDIFLTIPRGTIFAGGGPNDKTRWILQDDIITDDLGVGTGIAAAEDAGPISAGDKTITRIVTPLPGLVGVTNRTPATPGALRETDEECLIRRARSLSSTGDESVDALVGQTLNLTFISSATVVQNRSGLDTVVKGITLPSHSFALVVTPSTLTEEQRADLAAVVYDNTPIGIKPTGIEEAIVVKEDTFEDVTRWSYAQGQQIQYTIQLEPKRGYSFAALRTVVNEVAVGYFASLQPGQDAVRWELSQLIAKVEGIRRLEILFAGNEADASTSILFFLRPAPGSDVVPF